MFGFKVLLLCIAVVPALSEPCCSENKYCCPVDWLGFRGHCYGYFAYHYNHAQAKGFCQNLGADLASIHSEQENAILNAFVKGENIWIALNDLRVEGTYEWADGTARDFTNWYATQPDGLDGEDCAEMNWPSFTKGTWNDAQCSWKHGFLCMK